MQNDRESDHNTESRPDYHEMVTGWACRIVFVMAVAIAGQTFKDVYEIMHPPEPPVIGLYPDGRLQTAVRLDKPILDDVALKTWVEQAVLHTCNIDWLNWNEKLNEAADALLPAAVLHLRDEMVAKNITKGLGNDRLREWCSLTGPSWIAERQTINNYLYYEVKFPMVVRFFGQDAARDRTSQQNVRVIVMQVPRSVKPRGFGIASIQVDSGKPPVDGS